MIAQPLFNKTNCHKDVDIVQLFTMKTMFGSKKKISTDTQEDAISVQPKSHPPLEVIKDLDGCGGTLILGDMHTNSIVKSYIQSAEKINMPMILVDWSNKGEVLNHALILNRNVLHIRFGDFPDGNKMVLYEKDWNGTKPVFVDPFSVWNGSSDRQQLFAAKAIVKLGGWKHKLELDRYNKLYLYFQNHHFASPNSYDDMVSVLSEIAESGGANSMFSQGDMVWVNELIFRITDPKTWIKQRIEASSSTINVEHFLSDKGIIVLEVGDKQINCTMSHLMFYFLISQYQHCLNGRLLPDNNLDIFFLVNAFHKSWDWLDNNDPMISRVISDSNLRLHGKLVLVSQWWGVDQLLGRLRSTKQVQYMVHKFNRLLVVGKEIPEDRRYHSISSILELTGLSTEQLNHLTDHPEHKVIVYNCLSNKTSIHQIPET